MTNKPEPRRRRGTPISAGFGADLQTLGTLLANHTRGLDTYLQHQASRLEERHHNILADAEGFLLPPDLNLEAMTAGELQNLCRSKRLRGWSKLRRDELLTFVKQQLGRELEMMRRLHQEQGAVASQADSADHSAQPPAVEGQGFPADASRSERLLLLLLRQLEVSAEQLQAAWQGDDAG